VQCLAGTAVAGLTEKVTAQALELGMKKEDRKLLKRSSAEGFVLFHNVEGGFTLKDFLYYFNRF
jgi:hypothetical protein